MRRISFKVKGELPPKKGGDLSMWGKPIEAKRLLALRRKALETLNSSPFTGPVRLTLSIHVGDQAPVFTNAGNPVAPVGVPTRGQHSKPSPHSVQMG